MEATVVAPLSHNRIRVTVDNGTRYQRVFDGRGYSTPMGGWRLQPMTPELRTKINDEKERSRLAFQTRNQDWEEVPLPTLRAIAKLLDEVSANAEKK
jgi:hypothetical protein